MAVQNIVVGQQFQAGRVSTFDATIGQSFIRYIDKPVTLGTDTLVFQFPQAVATGNTFGIPRCMFIDNSDNNYQMTVDVSGSQQTFPVPANSTGFYLVDGQASSNITVTSNGVPGSPVEFIFYNYERQPIVWYKFGTANVTVNIPDGADVALGETTDAPVTNPASNATLIALTKGLLSKLASGIVVTSSAVTVADGADIAEGSKADAAVTNPASSGSVIALLKGVLTAVNTVATNIVSVVTNTNAFSYVNIVTSTTTVVKNAPGTLGKITVNTIGGAGNIIVYDNTSGSGSIIATIDSTILGSYDYNVSAGTGITVVTTGAPDITVTYK